jgi:hypothetical protein
VEAAAVRACSADQRHCPKPSGRLGAGTRADVIVKVRHGIVYEIGLVNRHLTTGRKATRLFLTSFPHVGVAA